MTIKFVFFYKGNILRSEIDGCILMKNFVAGSPEVKIMLNDDFFVGKSDVVSRGNGKFRNQKQCGISQRELQQQQRKAELASAMRCFVPAHISF